MHVSGWKASSWLHCVTITFLLLVVSFSAEAQTKYWVLLKDKANVPFDPHTYFDSKALERRQRQRLPLSDDTDKPLNPLYVQQVKSLADSVTGQSRWLNAVACFAQPHQLEQLRKLACVAEIVPMQPQAAALAGVKNFKTDLTQDQEMLLHNQTASLGAALFREKQLDGKGIRVAVLDAGFSSLQKNPAFEHLRQEKRILKTWDFVRNRENVDGYSSHGTMVLSCIGGRLNGFDIGLATGAEFLLARTERQRSERFSEEEFWLAAMEWADKNGADIINSSLGYTNDRYFREQMDGRTALVARAANLAARKGMLVVNANGNDGSDNTWKVLGTPADADSVLAVGGVDPKTLFHAGFSSFGPTSDKRLKPNVSAFGLVIASGPGGFTNTQGTSFSSPLVAGFAACAWQANRQLSNMQLFHEIERSGNLYPYFDYAHGYGIPQAAYFLHGRQAVLPTFDTKRIGNQLQVQIRPEYLADSMAKVPQPGYQPPYHPLQVNFEPKEYLYYHVENNKGSLDRYYVVEVQQPVPVSVNLQDLKPGTTIRVFYRGYQLAYTL